MSSFFDDLKAKIAGADTEHLKKMLNDLVGDAEAGIDKVKSEFEAAGLKEKVESWIGKGANEPVSADEVKSALGEERLQKVASAAGTDVDGAAAKVAEALPQVVDKLTPGGTTT
jgi:uncharacterized protein YidB (DUF937 family)